MYSLILMSMFVLPAEAKADAPAAPKLDGKWLIVYAEEGGRRNNSWEQQQATFSDNTLTYAKEGKSQSIHLTFGPHQTVKASMTVGDKDAKEGKAYSGVSVAGQDYYCLSLEGSAGAGSGSFILILRRQRTGSK